MPSHRFPLLSTVREAVVLLGGTNATAARFGVTPAAVSIWLRKGCFPPARYIEISEVALQEKHRVDRSLFQAAARLKTVRGKRKPHAA